MTKPRFLYKLSDSHEIVKCESVEEWAEWIIKGENCLFKTEVHGHSVATIFLGMILMFDEKFDPLLPPFETMILCPHGSSDQTRKYYTYEEAKAGHEEVVEQLTRLYQSTVN